MRTAPDPVGLLRRSFPDVTLWFGHATGSYWALVPVPDGWRLVEANSPNELGRAVNDPCRWPWPSPL